MPGSGAGPYPVCIRFDHGHTVSKTGPALTGSDRHGLSGPARAGPGLTGPCVVFGCRARARAWACIRRRYRARPPPRLETCHVLLGTCDQWVRASRGPRGSWVPALLGTCVGRHVRSLERASVNTCVDRYVRTSPRLEHSHVLEASRSVGTFVHRPYSNRATLRTFLKTFRTRLSTFCTHLAAF